jgi:hypothetical protein
MSFYAPKPITPQKHSLIQEINLSWIELKSFLLYWLILLTIYSLSYYFYHFKEITEKKDFFDFLKILTQNHIYLFNFISLHFMLFFFLARHKITQLILIFISFLFLESILYLFLIPDFEISLHILSIWFLAPFILIYCANEHLLDIPFRWFIKIHTYTTNSTNLFTDTKSYTAHHIKDDIYIDVFIKNTNFKEKKFIEIKTQYLRLIKFWYTQKNYLFKLRFFFPLLMIFIGSLYFFYLLNYINNCCQIITPLNKLTIMGISLILFFLTMSYHINNFLDSKFYMGNILKKLNKIYFDNLEYKHQLRLFLDKHLLVYIHDRYHDRHFCVNTSKDFQNFIAQEKQDEQGRNMIITVYTTFIMILFIEIFVNPPPSTPSNQKNPLTLSTQIERNKNHENKK